MKEFDIKLRTFNFSKDLLEFSGRVNKNLATSVITKQMIRSGTSIGANVHESKGGTSKKDFAHYFSIALKSANETAYWLKLIESTNPALKEDVSQLSSELDEITKILAKIVINSRKEMA